MWAYLLQRAFLRKPLHIFEAEESQERLERSLNLFDLLCVGVGGTLGSGIFVLTGLISRQYAGPGVVYSWFIAGACTTLSAMAYAEMSSRISSSGSSYAYAYNALGELPAFIAAWCMTLEYGISGSAIACSWGNKFEFTLQAWGIDISTLLYLEHTYGINIFAGLMQLLCMCILLAGVKVGKLVVNTFSIIKMTLVLFMIITGFLHYNPVNVQDMAPLGVRGIMRGSSSAFFGLLGYDEVCILAAEAKDPHRTLPLAVFGTIAICTLCSALASLALVGMQPWQQIDPDNGFSNAFRAVNAPIAQYIVSAGEVLTLPLVVLVSFLAQPRLQYVMALDSLVPSVFAEIDSKGNLSKGIILSGLALTAVALVVPFAYLNDMISAGVLISFNITNSALVATRRGDPQASHLCHKLLALFHLLCIAFTVILANIAANSSGLIAMSVLFLAMLAVALAVDVFCPEKEDPEGHAQFRVPFVPYLPLTAILLNYCMVGELSASGINSILIYIGVVTLFYFAFSIHYSAGNNGGWMKVLGKIKSVAFEYTGLADDEL